MVSQDTRVAQDAAAQSAASAQGAAFAYQTTVDFVDDAKNDMTGFVVAGQGLVDQGQGLVDQQELIAGLTSEAAAQQYNLENDPGVRSAVVTAPGAELAEYAVATKKAGGDVNNVQWTTKEELIARTLGWAILTDPQYAGGADPTGAVDCRAAFVAWRDALRGGVSGSGATPTSVLSSVTGYIPAGTYKVTPASGAGLEVVNTRGLHIKGAGSRLSTLEMDGTFTGDALAIINCQNSLLSDFRITGTSGTTVADSVVAFDTISARGGSASSPSIAHRIYIETDAFLWKYGMSFGLKSGTSDVAQVSVTECLVRGAYVPPNGDLPDDSPTYHLAGFVSGSGGLGNILNHQYLNSRSHAVRYAWIVDNVHNVSVTGCNSSEIGTWLYLKGNSRVTFSAKNVRIEEARRLIETGANGAATAFVTLDTVMWGGNPAKTVYDREIVRFNYRGTLAIRNNRWDSSSPDGLGWSLDQQAYKIALGASGVGQQQHVFVEGLATPNASADSLFAIGASAAGFWEVKGLDQRADLFGSANRFVGRASASFGGGFGEERRLTRIERTTNYTLSVYDIGKHVDINASGARTLTVPPDSTAAYPVGSQIIVGQQGTGQVTLTPGAGVTINSRPGLKTAGQYAMATLVKIATDTWRAYGDLVL